MKRGIAPGLLMACVLGITPPGVAAQQLPLEPSDRLSRTELENEIGRLQLEREELGLGRPIALTAGGSAGLIASGLVAFYTLLVGDFGRTGRLDNESNSASRDCGDCNMFIAGLIGVGVSAGFLVWGLIDLRRTLHARRANTRQLRELLPLRDSDGPRAGVDLQLRPHGLRFEVAVHF